MGFLTHSDHNQLLPPTPPKGLIPPGPHYLASVGASDYLGWSAHSQMSGRRGYWNWTQSQSPLEVSFTSLFRVPLGSGASPQPQPKAAWELCKSFLGGAQARRGRETRSTWLAQRGPAGTSPRGRSEMGTPGTGEPQHAAHRTHEAGALQLLPRGLPRAGGRNPGVALIARKRPLPTGPAARNPGQIPSRARGRPAPGSAPACPAPPTLRAPLLAHCVARLPPAGALAEPPKKPKGRGKKKGGSWGGGAFLARLPASSLPRHPRPPRRSHREPPAAAPPSSGRTANFGSAAEAAESWRRRRG